ncbi:spore coat associated protein CotJA [Gracilibacillus salinarum]|uniref:Spore coat associated protein CotJA n=1 Tax=Gracilibacillus salinarum TaxID=2932255 RepID=A0ABY4GNK8_9BACI|nr:spore coat associated protein CotJA [Gracilibacillus salinarum]UOQ85902.1 spore coat associated protein CotJA [Gracilibacillus salinarum]
MSFTTTKCYSPYVSKFDPCKPIKTKCYSTPPNLYIGFQPKNAEQFPTARDALFAGTLWPCLYDDYPPRKERSDT